MDFQGHEYLTKIGILHRDISENNIVLARRPGEERGYLIDFDMATLQGDLVEKPVQVRRRRNLEDFRKLMKASSSISMNESKALRTVRIFRNTFVRSTSYIRSWSHKGTMPYMSFNVLRGGTHTYYDDIESFLYVLLLFFFSYAGPLSKEELLAADTQGFVHPLGSGCLAHMRHWPAKYTFWAEGDMASIAASKDSGLNLENGGFKLIRSAHVQQCMTTNWPGKELQRAIMLLLGKCWQMFIDSRRCPAIGLSLEHTRVSHEKFVGFLDRWLAEFGDLEASACSSCPF